MICDTPYLQNEFGDPWFFYVFNAILSFSTCKKKKKNNCTWDTLGANILNSIMLAELFCFNRPGPKIKYIGVNLQFLQFVHRSVTSTLNVLKTTVPHNSNKIINIIKKIVWIRLEEYFQNVFTLKDVSGYKKWNRMMIFIFINLWRKRINEIKKQQQRIKKRTYK